MTRVILSGFVAGLVVFIWGFVSHVLLPLGQTGIQSLPNEESVLPVMRENIARPGFYFFPGMEETPGAGREQQAASMKAWEERLRRGPSGILVYQPGGSRPMSPRQLGTEALTNILGALIAAALLAMAGAGLASFGARVFFVALLGLFASLAVDLSYWNWCGFPGSYTVAALVDQVVGWTLAGLVLGAMLKPRLT